jgi:acyl-CoA reductase-like NAD-dependent aldehyde dehydrogenase
MPLHVKPGTEWAAVLGRAADLAPEAFGTDRLFNLIDGSWRPNGDAEVLVSPVDGSKLTGLPRLSAGEAKHAVHASAVAHAQWATTPVAQRKARVSAAVDAMVEHREVLALLLSWEIGKPWKLACADVDRALDGVRWYVEEIESMLGDRMPLDGPVSNIASWNYPMSVLVHAELVQMLAGNASWPRRRPRAGLPV